jgi:hypothetical protein
MTCCLLGNVVQVTQNSMQSAARINHRTNVVLLGSQVSHDTQKIQQNLAQIQRTLEQHRKSSKVRKSLVISRVGPFKDLKYASSGDSLRVERSKTGKKKESWKRRVAEQSLIPTEINFNEGRPDEGTPDSEQASSLKDGSESGRNALAHMGGHSLRWETTCLGGRIVAHVGDHSLSEGHSLMWRLSTWETTSSGKRAVAWVGE